MYCVDLAENTPFKSFGVIRRSLPPSSFPDELLMDRIMASFQLERYVWPETDSIGRLAHL